MLARASERACVRVYVFQYVSQKTTTTTTTKPIKQTNRHKNPTKSSLFSREDKHGVFFLFFCPNILFIPLNKVLFYISCVSAIYSCFLKIMTDTLEDHEGTVSIGGTTITNLRWWHQWLNRRGRRPGKIVEHFNKASKTCGMEISSEKTKLMTTPMASTQKLKQMDRSLEQSQASSTWAQLQLMRVPSQRYSPG